MENKSPATKAAGKNGNFLEQLADKVHVGARAEGVYGAPIERDGVTVIPVARIEYGFGGGMATAEGPGGGGGAVRAVPIGFIRMHNGIADFQPIANETVQALSLAALLGKASEVVGSTLESLRSRFVDSR